VTWGLLQSWLSAQHGRAAPIQAQLGLPSGALANSGEIDILFLYYDSAINPRRWSAAEVDSSSPATLPHHVKIRLGPGSAFDDFDRSWRIMGKP